MVKSLDDFAHDVPPTPLTTSRDQFAEQAYSLLTSSAAQAAFRMNEEPAAVREKYGRTTVGQSCLLARRLVEAGVSFVTVNDRGTGPLGWDTHAQNFPTIKNTLAPPLDKGVAALVEDLAERGLLDEHAGRHDGRVRPDAQDQPQRRPRPSRPGQLASCSSVRASPAAWSSAGPTPAATHPPSAPSRRPTWPRCSITSWESTPRPSTKHPTAGRSGWSMGATRRWSCSERASRSAALAAMVDPPVDDWRAFCKDRK